MNNLHNIVVHIKDEAMLQEASLTEEHFYDLIEQGKIYLQHDQIGAEHFKHIKWFWNKTTEYINDGVTKKKEAAIKIYDNVREWVRYCGGINSGLWHPSLSEEITLPELEQLLKHNRDETKR